MKTGTKMEQKKQYEVGDVVISDTRWHGLEMHSVVKVGKLHATLDNGIKIRVDALSGTGGVGRERFGSSFYRLVTPQLQSRYDRQQLERKSLNAVKRIDIPKMSDEQLTKLISAINEIIQ